MFAYDIQEILNHIVNKEKLITAEQFNLKLKNCQMSIRDRKNRPNIFKTRSSGSKYEGTSSSLRILSRVVTIVLDDVLVKSQTMGILLKLQEVAELVTAPRLTHYEVYNILEPTIFEFLDLRVSSIEDLSFSRPRPKHHYLSHYGEAYVEYGPLIGVWGMRMESKHTYMKSVIRTAKNFINPSKTCASRHQLAQVSYAYEGLFPVNPIEMPDDTLSVFQVPITNKDDCQRKFLSVLDQNASYPAKLFILGTLYQPGMILILGKPSFGELLVGLLKAMSVNGGEVTFCCSSFECTLSNLGYYISRKKVSDFVLLSGRELWDYHPLHRMGTLDSFMFPLHHFVTLK